MSPLALAHPVRGRDELLAELADGIHGRITVLWGFRGVGTSTVATALAQRVQARTWFVRAADADALRAGMVSLAYELGAGEGEVRSRHLGDLVWQRLHDLDTHWLLVLDGVTEPDALGTDGTGFLRQPPDNGALVVTAQTDRWPGWVTERAIDTLDAESGARVLLDRAPAAGSVESAARVSERYANFPAALDIVGTQLASGAEGVTTCDEHLATYVRHAYADQIEDLLDDPRIGLAGRFGAAGRHDFVADQLLNLLSLLGPAPIPYSALTADLAPLTGPGGLRDGITAERLDAALRDLADHGSVTMHDAGPPSIGRLVRPHPIMRTWIRDEIASGFIPASRAVWVRVLASERRGGIANRPATDPLWTLLAPHLRCLVDDLARGPRADRHLIADLVPVLDIAAVARNDPGPAAAGPDRGDDGTAVRR
ncbi:hypothetical protein [Actinocatenispora sera]|uniref:NB-ARC domain-containing protein n=1 Tax=Actinocatenispora sera TaxID=390989 RepID=A0A810KWI3_9ACTN|nr:hypothetical protein [Actinocatenispora sera]BCJ26438.1 hypothetical protein Asera_05460 [Actinocatenispora sera]